MNYAKIETCDVVNGPGARTTLFVCGCSHNCFGCHNKEAQNFKFGSIYTKDTENFILKSLEDKYIAGLSISGGDPLHPKNVEQISKLVDRVRDCFGENKTIWVWTGYTLKELLERECHWTANILSKINTLVDGRFVEQLKDTSLRFRGSSNQQVITINNH